MPVAALCLYSPSWGGHLALASLSPDSQKDCPLFPTPPSHRRRTPCGAAGRSLRSALDLPVGTHRRRLSPRPVRHPPRPRGPEARPVIAFQGAGGLPGRPGGRRAGACDLRPGSARAERPGAPACDRQPSDARARARSPAGSGPGQRGREARLRPAAFVCCGPREA